MQARQKNLHMTLSLEGEGRRPPATSKASSLVQLRVIGDAVKLTQVMRNLLSNALKFTPQDGRIEVSGESRPSSVVCCGLCC